MAEDVTVTVIEDEIAVVTVDDGEAQATPVEATVATVEIVQAGPRGEDGYTGWTPEFAVVIDGSRRVQQVVDWFGGEGDIPPVGQYVGPDGFVTDIAEAVDIRGPSGSGGGGENGWSPIFALINDGERRVMQVIDWVGGDGIKPPVGEYLGTTGFVTDIADANNIRGPQGADGISGTDGWTPILAAVNDGERRVFQVIDWIGGTGVQPPTGLYVGPTGFVANISEALDIRGPAGPQGIQGDVGPQGIQGDVGPEGPEGPAGENGQDGWTPITAIATDGERRVLQVTSWTGGEGTPPPSPVYVGATGFVTDIAEAVDIRGPQGQQGEQGDIGPEGPTGDTGATGDDGWSPVLAIVTDGERRVFQIVDWVGGEGTKPSVIDQFVGPTGIVNTAAAAVDIRGPQGEQGIQGEEGPPGTGDDGWTPVLAVVTDGERRVLQIVDWVGGEGTKPSIVDQYVGPTGIVNTPGAAVDIRGPQGAQGEEGPAGDTGATGDPGDNGWSPVFAVVTDGERRVLQITDWVGGEGTKPSTINQFVGPTGIVNTAAAAVDIRGPVGADGADGAPGSVWREGTGAPSNALGIDGDFYLDDATGDVYQKSAGTYSVVANIKGPQGDPGGGGGLPAGGTTDQYLQKASSTDYDAQWSDLAAVFPRMTDISNSNLDDVVTSGWYYGANLTNAPGASAGGFQVQVIRGLTGGGLERVSQIAYQQSVVSLIGMHVRKQVGAGNWSSWFRIITDNEGGTISNKTLESPVFSGTITGTYTIGGTPTWPSDVVLTTATQTLTNKALVSPIFSGNITGTYALGIGVTNINPGTLLQIDGEGTTLTTGVDRVLISGEGAAITEAMAVASSGAAGHRPIYNFLRARGTLAAPEAVQAGDLIGDFLARGWNPSGSLTASAGISFVAEGLITGTQVPIRIDFTSGLTQASRTARLSITSDGNIGLMNASGYLNWSGTTFGSTGYGFRNNSGNIDVKHSGGDWSPIVTESATQTLTNKTLTAPVFSGTITGTYTLGGTPTFPSSVVTLTGTQTLTNKTITAPVFSGTITGTYTLGGTPTFPSTVVLTTGAQTLANKTLTAPVINSPTGIVKADVGLGNVDNTSDATKNAATATLTNKTLTSPILNQPVINNNVSFEAVSRTLALTDNGKLLLGNHASTPVVLTVPPNSTVAFPIGAQVDIGWWDVAATSVVAGAGVTIISADSDLGLRTRGSTGTLVKVATDSWLLSGDIA